VLPIVSIKEDWVPKDLMGKLYREQWLGHQESDFGYLDGRQSTVRNGSLIP
jgi:hypothetical protein